MPRAILDPVTTVRPATRLWVDGEHLDAPVLERSDLSGFVPGPAVIADRSATTLVPVGWAASLDEHSNLVLERSAS